MNTFLVFFIMAAVLFFCGLMIAIVWKGLNERFKPNPSYRWLSNLGAYEARSPKKKRRKHYKARRKASR